ncbi:MAG TPA: hypothetical protein VE090_04635 [Methylomirabilota bacterium]|nr:hypothetical protein [Methylomirabilota bacterium]
MFGIFRNKGVLLGCLFLLIVFFGIGAYFVANPSGKTAVKGIYGIFDINGVIPSGSTITIMQRDARGTSSFVPFAANIIPQDGGFWHFSGAITNKSYEIQGAVVQNGKVIYLTSPIFATAPAINQVLIFDVPSAQPAGNATISGSVGIDGYIPSGATLSLEGRKVGAQKFTIVTKNIPAKDQQFISYTTALAGQGYEVKGLLFDASGQPIGESAILTVVAPAYNENLNINSTAIPPVTATPTPTLTTTQPTQASAPTTPPTPTPLPASTISGIIRFDGQTPPNSRVVIFQRTSGTTNFQAAVNNVTAEDGTTWQWNGGTTAHMYDMIAILKQKQSDGTDKDISNSNILSLTAPAANETFTINSGFLLPAPGGGISVACDNYDGGSQTWNVGLSFGTVQGAQSYWFQIGTTNGGIELTNFTQNSTNNTNQSFTQQFKNGTTYYARYAYANVSNLQANSGQFSAFSGTTQLRCSK